MATIVLAYKYGSFAADSTLTIGTDISASDAASLVGNGEARWGTAGPLSSSGDVLPLWTANTVYPAQTEILDPTGVTILVRKTAGTSRSTYDATEQALWSAAGAGGGSALTPTAVKTANYTAVAGDFVPVDTTSGNVTVTLPTAPADKTQVEVKHVIRGGTNVVTVACGGSDVFNKTGGTTTSSLILTDQGKIYQYKASSAIWYAISDDLALSQLDGRYPAISTPATTGYDVWLLIGQSNMVGYSGSSTWDYTNYDIHDAKVWQYDWSGAVTKVAYDPLAHADGGGQGVGPGMAFARWAAAIGQGRRILLVPSALGGTGFTGAGANLWDSTVSPSLYTAAVAHANAAIAAVQAVAPNSKIAGFIWQQGETDGWSNRTQAQYAANLDALIDALRANVTGATSTTPFILGRMVPEFVGSAGSGTSDQIDKAHADTPRRKLYTWVADGPSGSANHDGTNIYHYSPAGARLLGQRHFFALTNALANNGSTSLVPAAPAYPKVVQNGSTGTTLTWLPATANATVSGYEVWRGTAAGGETLLTTLGNVLTYADNTANGNGTTYYYKLRAINVAGNSPYSDEVSLAFTLQTLIASDDFNRSDTAQTNSACTYGTTPVGSKTWTYKAGFRSYISSNTALMQAANGTSFACNTVDAGVADVDVRVNVVAFGQPDTGIVARYVDENNFYFGGAYSSGAYYLMKNNAGVITPLTNPGLYTGAAPTAGDQVRLVVKGSALTLYVNGVSVLATTDTQFASSTLVGIREKGGLANMDNFAVYTAP